MVYGCWRWFAVVGGELGIQTMANNRKPLPTIANASSLICADGALHGGFWDGIDGRIAEAEEHLFGARGFARLEKGDGVLQGVDAEIVFLAGALDAVEKRGEVD